MARVKGGVVSRKRRKHLKLAKVTMELSTSCSITAKEQMTELLPMHTVTVVKKKRDFRKLWIITYQCEAAQYGADFHTHN